MEDTEVKITKDRMEGKLIAKIFHSCISMQPSYLFCDRIDYIHERRVCEKKRTFNHHLMFYRDDELVFKVWLPNDKRDKHYKGIEKALRAVNVEV